MLVFALCGIVTSCGPGSGPPIDLLRELSRAERRAAGPVDTSIRVALTTIAGDTRVSLIMTAPARVTWSVRFPARATVKTGVALIAEGQPLAASATARIGIAGGRAYETLLTLRLPHAVPSTPKWRPIQLDLSEYSGWQWSLFYHPSRQTWNLVFAADATPRGTIAWAHPVIELGR
jgi:hypothetical protein